MANIDLLDVAYGTQWRESGVEDFLIVEIAHILTVSKFNSLSNLGIGCFSWGSKTS